MWMMIRKSEEMGMEKRETAKELGMSRNTLRKIIQVIIILDPYKPRIREVIWNYNFFSIRIRGGDQK